MLWSRVGAGETIQAKELEHTETLNATPHYPQSQAPRLPEFQSLSRLRRRRILSKGRHPQDWNHGHAVARMERRGVVRGLSPVFGHALFSKSQNTDTESLLHPNPETEALNTDPKALKPATTNPATTNFRVASLRP